MVWLTDLDKAMAAGDIFIYFFEFRARHGEFSDLHNELMKKALRDCGLLTEAELKEVAFAGAAQNAYLALRLWKRHQLGQERGIRQHDLWRRFYTSLSSPFA